MKSKNKVNMDVFSNYKMNLLQVCKSEEYNFSNEDIQTVFEISRNIYEEDFDEIKRVYKNRDIKAELAMVIGKITDSNYIIEEAKEGKETVNMCTALENLRRQGVEEGKLEGKIEGIRDGMRKKEIEISKVLIKKGLSIDEISDITGLTIEEVKGLANSKEQ